MTMLRPLSTGGEPSADLELTLFAVDTPASPSQQRERCAESRTTGTSGQLRAPYFAYYDPITHCLRTSQLTLDLGSIESSPTLPPSGSMRNGALFQRPRWGRHIDAPDCSYWPTPTSQNLAGGVGYQNSRKAGGPTIRWPTLTGAVRMSVGRPIQSPGLVNPAWVEWLMGLPIGWTEVDSTHSETRSSPPSPNTSDAD